MHNIFLKMKQCMPFIFYIDIIVIIGKLVIYVLFCVNFYFIFLVFLYKKKRKK